jgi:hypothetical protein
MALSANPALISEPPRQRPMPAEASGAEKLCGPLAPGGGSALSFNVLAIRSGLDTGDDALHPVLSDTSSPDIIDFDAYDGPNVMRVVATAVCVMRVRDGGLKTLTRLRDVKIGSHDEP